MPELNKSPGQPQTVLFVHIPKTAGATLEHILTGQYPRRALYNYRDHPAKIEQVFGGWSETQKASYRAIYGHMFFGAHRYLPQPSTYITILRDPIARVISYYYFIRQRPAHERYAEAHQFSMDEFIERRLITDNGQVRYLSGINSPDGAVCTTAMLEEAKRNLDAHFVVAGLTEHFDESLILIKRALGWRIPFYFRRNVALKRERLPDSTIKLIERYNTLDMELHAHCRTGFEKLLSQQGEDFERELRLFKRLNPIYERPFTILRGIVRKVRTLKSES